jgi:hypothetical protein
VKNKFIGQKGPHWNLRTTSIRLSPMSDPEKRSLFGSF